MEGNREGFGNNQNLNDESVVNNFHTAGRTLGTLASRRTYGNQLKMSDLEQAELEKSLAVGADQPRFKKYYVDAMKAALKSENLQMAEVLLKKDLTYRFLVDETPLLHLAVAVESTWYYRYSKESKIIPELLRHLVAYGADVNMADSECKTPLYYACVGGRVESFKTLIDLGADVHTVHEALPNYDIDKETQSHSLRVNGSRKVNLLDIVLECYLGLMKDRPVPSIWSDNRKEDWGYIICFLLEKRLDFQRDDARLLKFFLVTCYQGNLEQVERLLDLDIDQNARAARSDFRDYVSGSALHAAVKGGQSAIVKCLLDHGAVANAQRMCTSRLQHLAKPMTPIAYALEWTTIGMLGGPGILDILDACALLLDEGVDEEDRKLLLAECARKGDFQAVKRLLICGTRLPEIPLSDDINIIREFVVAGTKVNAAKSQRHAVEQANLGIMRFLVEMNGPALLMEEFGFIAFELIRGNSDGHMEMLRYIITEYGFDVNTTFPAYPNANYHVNLLQRACEEIKPSAVQLLLEHGADPECLGLPDTALEYMKKGLRSRGLRISHFAETDMPIIRLLIKHGGQPQVPSASRAELGSRTPPETIGSKYLSCAPHKTSMVRPSQTSLGHTQPRISGSDDLPAARAIPWIEETVETFRYASLQGLKAIRLIEIEPSESVEDPIRCGVLHTYPSSNVQYEVLSCHWDSSSQSVPILLDGKTYEAPSSIWSGLCRIRLKDRIRLVWSEAICINRDDVDERKTQLALLKDTYRRASRSLVWLGDSAENSHLVFGHLKDCEAKGKLNYSGHSGETREALLKLCHRPWFFRSRSALEIGMSNKNALVMCGQDQDDFDGLMKGAYFSSEENWYHPLHGPESLNRFRTLRDIKEHSPISHILQYMSDCTTNDPRDKIFDIAELRYGVEISIDFKADVTALSRILTQKTIQTTKDIQLLHWLGTQTRLGGLPSWVPDFSSTLSTAVLPRIVGSWSRRGTYPSHILPGISFPSDGSLVINGRAIEKIQSIAAELPIINSNTQESETFSNTLREWESLATQLLTTKRFPQAISGAFSETLMGDDRHDQEYTKRPVFSWYAEDFAGWYSRYGSGVLAKADATYFDELAEMQAWIHDIKNGDKSDSTPMKEKDWSNYAKRVEIVSYGRRFFITDRGSMGLAPAGAKEGDELVFFPGGRYPFVLRGNKGEKDGTYEMIGDCFLYDFNIFGLFEDRDIETRKYAIF